jgi:hypothetical protein
MVQGFTTLAVAGRRGFLAEAQGAALEGELRAALRSTFPPR